MGEERRVVTVLFADVSGSTELGDTLDPEDLRALMGDYYAVARDVVGAHGGTLEKFIGDAVMAVFGLPAAHGDDADRALSVALELRDRVRSHPRLREQIRLRIGVNTGDVIATPDPSASDFLVTGDAVNVASRLQQEAHAWAILCGERTVRAGGMRFAFGPMLDVEVKGKRTAVRAAALLGRPASAAGPRIPFVGRDVELAELDVIARRAFDERRPAFVTVVAPAGTGKSRLVDEFLARLPDIAPRSIVAKAQCLPYGQRLTYWPLRAVLARLVGASDDDPPKTMRAAIDAWLRDSGADQADRVGDLLAATIGLGGEVSDRPALLVAWRTAVEIGSRADPLVIVLEDLHWSSDSLLELVEFLTQPRGDAPVLVIALTRPELLDRRPAWGGGRRNYTSLFLEPLSDEAVGEIVRHLLRGDESELVARVIARAEGNPFYAGELVRAVLDRSSDQALTPLPDTVQATVLARLDLLRADERRALQLGSIFGRAFRGGGLVALDPGLETRRDEILEVLLAKDLIVPGGIDSFAFRHILIRDVAYQTLPRAERARLHAAAARWLETAAERDPTQAELVALHYREAATLAHGDEGARGDLRASAVTWLVRASDVALSGAANAEAVRHLRAAVDLAEAGQLPDLYARIGDAFSSPEAAGAYRRALELSREAGRPADEQLRLIAGVLHVSMRSGGSVAPELGDDELGELRTEGHKLARRARDERALARFLAADSFYPFWVRSRGRRAPAATELESAQASASRALELADGIGDDKLRSAALDGLASVYSLRGDLREAREVTRRRLAMGERLDLVERLDAYTVDVWTSSWLGDLDEAIGMSAEGLGLVPPGQAPAWTLHLVGWSAFALMLRGRWNEALAAGERMRSLWLEMGSEAAPFALRGMLSALAVARWRGDEPAADRFAETLGAMSRASGGAAPRRAIDFLSEDPAELDHHVRHLDQRLPETFELALSFASDAGRPPAVRLLARLAANQSYAPYPLLQAEIRRALGLARHDAAELGAALATFEAAHAEPSVARVRCERAVITGDARELKRGLRELERLGDASHVARYRASATAEV